MKKLVLKAVGNKGAVTAKQTLQQGTLAVVSAQADTQYQLVDEATGLPPKGQVIKKKGVSGISCRFGGF